MQDAIFFIGIAICVLLSGCRNGDREDANLSEASERVESASQFAASGHPIEALSALHEFLIITEENPNAVSDSLYAHAYTLLGNLYCDYDDYALASTYYDFASERVTDEDTKAHLSHRLAVCYSMLGDHQKARNYYGVFLRLSRGREEFDFDQALTAGYIEKAFGSEVISEVMMKRALQLAREQQLDSSLWVLPVKELVGFYNLRNEPDSALMLIDILRDIATAKGSQVRISDCMRGAMRAWMLKGNLDSSLYYQQRYFETSSSALASGTFTMLSKEFNYQDEKRMRRRIDSLRHSVSIGQFILISLSLLPIILFLFFRWRRHERESRRRFYFLDMSMHRLRKRLDTDGDADSTDIFMDSTLPAAETLSTVDPERAALFRRITDIVARPEIFTDSSFSLPRLAEMLGINTKYVSETIKDFSGYNFRTFVNDYRIREARSRLLDEANYGKLTIQSVAESVGLNSQSSFISAFKQFTGMTPSYYMKMGASSRTQS